MMSSRTLVLLVLTLCPTTWMLAQASQSKSLSSAVIHKKLPNGFSYFLYPDTLFKKQKISLQLAIKAGSLQETQAQRGYAHFVEHMGFNGTQHFSQVQLMQFFNKAGMDFGADANAFTGFDRTAYRLDVPRDSLFYLEQALQITSDWAQGMSFLPNEVEREKGVILAERQMRNSPPSRFQERRFKWFFQKDNHLIDRFPIGDSTVIIQATAEKLRAFYQKWYRSESMALVVVGDFDPIWMEQQIEKLFQGMPASNYEVTSSSWKTEFAGQRQTFNTNESPYPFSMLHLSLNYPGQIVRDPDQFLRLLAIDHFIATLINVELQKDLNVKPLGANLFFTPVHNLGDMHYFQLSATGPQDVMPAVFRAALSPVIDLAKGNLSENRFANMQKRLISEAKRSNVQDIRHAGNGANELARLLSEAFLENLPYALQLDRWDLFPQIFASLQKDEIIKLAQHWLDTNQQMLLLAHPPSTSEAISQGTPNYWQILDSLVKHHQTLPDVAPLRAWFDSPLPQHVSIACQKDHAYDIREIQYTNGVKVAIKKLAGEPRMHFRADSYGGIDFISEEHQMIGNLLSAVAQQLGVGSFNTYEMAQRKADFDLEHYLVFAHTLERVVGSSSPDHFKDLLAMMHLYLSAPNMEQAVLDNLVQERRMQEKTGQLSLYNILADFHRKWFHNPDPYERQYTSQDIEQINIKDLEKVYRDRFCNPTDFDFVVIGDAPLDSMQAVVDVYLGNLPSKNTPRETYKTNPDKGPIIRPIVTVDTTLYLLNEPKAGVEINYLSTWKGKYTPRHLNYLFQVNKVLENTLRQLLREDKAATYYISVQSFTNNWRTGIQVIFECAPNRVQELEALADSCIQTLINKAVLGEIFKKQKQFDNYAGGNEPPLIRDFDYWLSRLQNDFAHLDMLDYTPEDQLDPKFTFTYKKRNDAPSIRKFHRFWKRLIVPTKKSRIILLPKTNQVP